MTENQTKRMNQLREYVDRVRSEKYYGVPISERDEKDNELKELCTNVLTYVILINEDE